MIFDIYTKYKDIGPNILIPALIGVDVQGLCDRKHIVLCKTDRRTDGQVQCCSNIVFVFIYIYI